MQRVMLDVRKTSCVIFKSQGGLDFELNYKYLESELHRGDLGPHKNRQVDLMYKIELQEKLEKLLDRDYYNIRELRVLLGLKEKQANQAFRKLLKINGISREDAIFRLLGDRFYKELE